MAQELERSVIELVATDRLYIPSSSFDGKLERSRPKIANTIVNYEEFDGEFVGDRTYARLIEEKGVMKRHTSKSLRSGIDNFKADHPEYGAILEGYIGQVRTDVKHLEFGMQEGKRVTHEDYLGVLANTLNLTPTQQDNYIDFAMTVSRQLQKNRDSPQRSITLR